MRSCVLSSECHGHQIGAASVPTAHVHRVCSLATQRRCRTVINVQCKSASATSDDGERKRPRKGTAASRKRHGGSTGQHSDRAWKQTRGTGDASRVTSDPRSSEGRSQVRCLPGPKLQRPRHTCQQSPDGRQGTAASTACRAKAPQCGGPYSLNCLTPCWRQHNSYTPRVQIRYECSSCDHP